MIIIQKGLRLTHQQLRLLMGKRQLFAVFDENRYPTSAGTTKGTTGGYQTTAGTTKGTTAGTTKGTTAGYNPGTTPGATTTTEESYVLETNYPDPLEDRNDPLKTNYTASHPEHFEYSYNGKFPCIRYHYIHRCFWTICLG